MAERARGVVAETAGVIGGNGQAGIENSLEHAAATIRNLLARMEASAGHALAATERIETLEGAAKQIVKDLAEVGNIAFQNKLLALNAKIESVHVGEAGAGFAIVADAISTQAGRSSEISESAVQAVKNMSSSMLSATGELKTAVANDREMLAASRAEVEQALRSLNAAHSEMTEALAASHRTSSQLAEDIAQAVMTLQFQDRVGQRLSHVSSALERMEKESHSDGDALANLRETYTMAAERSAASQPHSAGSKGLDETAGPGRRPDWATHRNPDCSDVEIF
jgi:methyl-accepting chemotaxis protein